MTTKTTRPDFTIRPWQLIDADPEDAAGGGFGFDCSCGAESSGTSFTRNTAAILFHTKEHQDEGRRAVIKFH